MTYFRSIKRFILASLALLMVSGTAGAAIIYQTPVLNNTDGNCLFNEGCVEGYQVATSFSVGEASVVDKVSFSALSRNLGNLDDITGIDWFILGSTGSLPSNTVYSSGSTSTYTASQHPTFDRAYEFLIDIPDVALGAGSYWLAFHITSPDNDLYHSASTGGGTSAFSNITAYGALWQPFIADGLAIAVYSPSAVPVPAAYSPSAVPVPAAVWLFGTALIGLVGFGKRRRAA